MNESQERLRRGAAAALAGVCLLLATAGCRQESPPGRGASRPQTGRVPAPTVLSPIPAGPDDLFEDVTAQAGLRFVHQYCDTKIANILESNGAGAAWLDFDCDGFVDVYFVNWGPLDRVTHAPPGTKREPNRLFRNRGDGTFEDVTEKAGVAGAGYNSAVAVGDYDNDGFPDIYIASVGRNILYHNRGNGTFEDATAKAGVGDTGTGISAVWLDIDNDGRLDLFVGNYLTLDPDPKLYFAPDGYPGPLAYKPEFNVLYRNKGDGTFEDVSVASGIRIADHRAMSVAAFDHNRDGHTDLYVSNDGTPNLLLLNDGSGHFRDIALKSGVAFNALGEAAGSMAAAIGDCNGDGSSDLFVTRFGYGSLYIGRPDGFYDDRMMASGVGALTSKFVGWGGAFLDFDNDTDLDLFIANGDAHFLVGWENLLLENLGHSTFTDAQQKGGAYFKTQTRGRGAVVGDYNNDGRPDLLVTLLADRAVLLKNRDRSGNHWLTLDLEGTQSNRDGYGALVTVQAGGKRLFAENRCPVGFLTQSDRRLHFGLGKATAAERIEIRWPGRQTQMLTNVPADQILKIKEPGERKP
jgi:enediyne biosynthesis protein E4